MNIKEYKKSKILKKFPYVVFMVLLLLLLSCIIWGCKIWMQDRGRINLTNESFLLYTGGVCIVAFIFGSMWTASLKAWDIQNFTDRIQNVDECDHIIFRTKRMRDYFIDNRYETFKPNENEQTKEKKKV